MSVKFQDEISKTINRSQGQKGVALPEIMLIISLVVILALLSYPKFNSAMTKAGRDSSLQASDALVKGLAMYQLDKRGFPKTSDISSIADYINVTSLQTAFSGLSLQLDLGTGACVRGIAARVEGTYIIANCTNVDGLNKGGYCCWQTISGDCSVNTGTPPYLLSANGWYECKSKL